MAGLRVATWSSHQRLEKRLDVKARFGKLDLYRLHLRRMWGFHATVEEQLGQARLSVALPDYDSRRKLPFLTQDLLTLEADVGFQESLERCPALDIQKDLASALGCAYVLEGATLGARTLLPLVQSRLGLTAETGARYLASYGDEVEPMWQTFQMAVEGWCCGPERQATAARAAVATFVALDAWLCGDRT
jgi:heme oxygenase